MQSILKSSRQSATAALTAALLATSALTVAPAAAYAVPAGGYADLVEQVSPAVVFIEVTSKAQNGEATMPQNIPPQLRRFFEDGVPGQQGPRQGLGSGFIVSSDGQIVTNHHVVAGADTVTVKMADERSFEAKVVGSDPMTDIALLKIEADVDLPFVSFGTSEGLRVGDEVVAVGNPFGLGGTVTSGIISALSRDIRSGPFDDFIQTDAAINRGNSGGPLFNLDGQVVGVNTAILSPTGGSIGIGFSMASNVVKRVVDQLQEFGETRRGWLGVRIQDVTADVAEAMGLEKAAGALVTDVPEGPAADAGMLAGDVITSFDGQDVSDTRSLVRTVGNTEVGKTVRVVVFREGKTTTLKITLGRREEAEGAIPVAQPGEEATPEAPVEKTILGLTLTPLSDELRAQLELDNSATGLVVVNIDELSEAYEKGLRAGDVITEAGQQKVASISDLDDRIAEAKEAGRKSLLMLVRSGGDPRFVALSLEDNK